MSVSVGVVCLWVAWVMCVVEECIVRTCMRDVHTDVGVCAA